MSVGAIHTASMLYLSAIICLAVSLNESRDPRFILRETLRRWVKFMGLSVVIILVVFILSR